MGRSCAIHDKINGDHMNTLLCHRFETQRNWSISI